MAFDPQAIREALAEQIRQNIARSVNVYAYKPTEPQYPYVAVLSDAPYIGYHETFHADVLGALCDMRVMIEISQAAEAQSAQIFIDDLLSAGTGQNSSVVDAIYSDSSLGGVVDTCRVMGAGPLTPNEDRSVFFALVPVSIAIRRT